MKTSPSIELDQSFSWQDVYLAHHEGLLGMARAITRDEHLAHDAVHEAFLISQSKWLHDRHESPLDSEAVRRFLTAATWRCAKNLTRHHRRRRGASDTFFDPAQDAASPASVLEQRETADLVHHAMQQLQTQEAQLLRMRYFEERSYETIARHFGINVTAARKRTHRALKRLEPTMRKTGLGAAMLALWFWGDSACATSHQDTRHQGNNPSSSSGRMVTHSALTAALLMVATAGLLLWWPSTGSSVTTRATPVHNSGSPLATIAGTAGSVSTSTVDADRQAPDPKRRTMLVAEKTADGFVRIVERIDLALTANAFAGNEVVIDAHHPNPQQYAFPLLSHPLPTGSWTLAFRLQTLACHPDRLEDNLLVLGMLTGNNGDNAAPGSAGIENHLEAGTTTTIDMHFRPEMHVHRDVAGRTSRKYANYEPLDVTIHGRPGQDGYWYYEVFADGDLLKTVQSKTFAVADRSVRFSPINVSGVEVRIDRLHYQERDERDESRPLARNHAH